MGNRIARATRTAAHGMGLVSTSLYALPGHGRSVVNRHLGVGYYIRHSISVPSRFLARGPSFSLCRDTVLSSTADGHRSVARTLRQRSRMLGSHSARALWSTELCYVCICADAGWLL